MNKVSEAGSMVSTRELAEILGMSDRRIRQLENDGALVKVSRGTFDLSASIQTYINYLLEKQKPDSEINKSEEEARWTKARREKAEMEIQIMRGELHRAEDVKSVMNHMLGNFRAKMLALPSKMAPQLVALTDVPRIKEILKSAVYETLTELSNYDPNVFYEISKDKMFLNDDSELNEADQPDKKAKKRTK